MPVCFTFTNGRDDAVTLPGSAPWEILDANGALAHASYGTAEAIEVEPGGSSGGCWWDPVLGGSAPAGRYVVRWSYHAQHELRSIDDPFDLLGTP